MSCVHKLFMKIPIDLALTTHTHIYINIINTIYPIVNKNYWEILNMTCSDGAMVEYSRQSVNKYAEPSTRLQKYEIDYQISNYQYQITTF